MYGTDLFYITVSINIYCIFIILHLDYVLFIWRNLDG